MELALRRHDGQLVLQVVRDEVADALEEHVFGSDLCGGQRETHTALEHTRNLFVL